MSRPLRFLPYPNTTFEITARIIQGRLLLRPSKELNEIVLGVIGRALARYPVLLHAFVFVSNHMHMLLMAPDAAVLAGFMCYVMGNLAKEAGRLHGWREKFWGRRYRAIPILDGESLVSRLRYLLEHGCKEGLVRRPADWPGVNCVKALTNGQVLTGVWFDRTKEYEARLLGKSFGKYEFATEYEVPLSPLPCWASLSEEERRVQTQAIVDGIEKETRERLDREGRGVLGVKMILGQSPTARPEMSKRSPAPACHAATPKRKKRYRRLYRKFVDLYREAKDKLLGGRWPVEFPEHSFPPALPYTGAAMIAAAPA